MRVPLSWLREHVDIDVSTEELATMLSMRGAAVDKVERFAEGVSGVVVGRVLEVAGVPESDKLCVAQVDAGRDKVQVVAGAKNFRKGDHVPVAIPGARVTTLDTPVGVRRMVGGKYESQGMLCSARELGVSDEHGGILVLEGDPPLGADVAGLLGLDDDVLEFEIYPNRPDQMSVLGIAREVALLYDKELRSPDWSVSEDEDPAISKTSVAIEDREGCPRYLARVIEDVRFGRSPALMQARLSACGFRPLGNLVDATNYVLLLCGQPLHAFDLDRLAEGRIVVRRARPKEKLTTLDEVERELDVKDLVIADARDAQAIAGVMGGAESEVGEATTRVLLESAYFDPIGVARTARRHHMRTEASARFERGADPQMVPDAASMAAELIRRWAGGTVAKGAVDEGAAPARRRLVLRPARIEAILGLRVGDETSIRVLAGLGCEVAQEDGAISVVPPSWRPDLEREIDLIEEIARVHGYENFPAAHRPGPRGGRSVPQVLWHRVRDVLLGAGLNEAILSSFVHADDLAALSYQGPLVRVANPMTEDQRQLRPSLFPGLLRAAQRNVARGVRSVRIFEAGAIFSGWQAGEPLPDESHHVGFVLVGDVAGEHWSAESREPDAFDAKGIIELLLGELGIRGWSLTYDVAPFFHPGRAANVMLEGVRLGRFGELRPSVAKAFDLEGAVLGGIAFDAVAPRAPESLRVGDLPAYPPALRDISMWLPAEVAAQEVISTIERAGGEHLEAVRLLDEYRPSSEERRSLAFGLTFRAPDRTLRAEEADAARQAIAEACRDGHGAQIR